jgi:hypothetical protein
MKRIILVKYPKSPNNTESFEKFKKDAETAGFTVLSFGYEPNTPSPPTFELAQFEDKE